MIHRVGGSVMLHVLHLNQMGVAAAAARRTPSSSAISQSLNLCEIMLSTSSSSSSRWMSSAAASAGAHDDNKTDIGGELHSVWYNNVYPIKLNRFDPRHYFVKRYAQQLGQKAKQSIIPTQEHFPGPFSYEGSTSSIKEGGLLMKFRYAGPVEEAYNVIKSHVEDNALRSYFNFGKIEAFLVQGDPFVEDLGSSIASSRVRIEFNGPDLTVEQLWKEFRQFGRIEDIVIQPATKDTPKYAHIQFNRVRSATSARICMYGKVVDGTRLTVNYEPALQRNAITNWVRDHPRLSLPIILAILAVISFVIFDPLRIFFVTNQIKQRFSILNYSNIVTQWISKAVNAVITSIYGDNLARNKTKAESKELFDGERAELEKKLLTYLKETPDTVFLVSGPKGTGKSELVAHACKNEPYKLTINLDELVNQPDHLLLDKFAHQVGYFPLFGWTVSFGSLLDTIVASLTGAKAGLASTTDGQVRKILEILTISMSRITQLERKKHQKLIDQEKALRNNDAEAASTVISKMPDIEYPVVVIEGFLTKENAKQSFMYELLTEWAAVLAENHVAQVVFVSNNPGAIKTIGRAVPTKTVETITLTDASFETALAYVQRRLGFTALAKTPVELEHAVHSLGGRLTDLDLLIQKIKATSKDATLSANLDLSTIISQCFSDIVVRSEAEIRKIGLFEDVANNVKDKVEAEWSPVQMWKIVQLLSKRDEIPYDDLRFHALFKGNEAPIQAIERAGLIRVDLHNGRPYSIRAGRPVYKSAFGSLLNDSKYAAIMGIQMAKTLIADEEAKIKKYEEELLLLTGTNGIGSRVGVRDAYTRVEYLNGLIRESQSKVKDLDSEERRLKRIVRLNE